jgi:hypothetical protein
MNHPIAIASNAIEELFGTNLESYQLSELETILEELYGDAYEDGVREGEVRGHDYGYDEGFDAGYDEGSLDAEETA